MVHHHITRSKIDFDKIESVEDIKSILKALDISWDAHSVPENIKHLVKEYDATGE